jgi:hypothetical protein
MFKMAIVLITAWHNVLNISMVIIAIQPEWQNGQNSSIINVSVRSPWTYWMMQARQFVQNNFLNRMLVLLGWLE